MIRWRFRVCSPLMGVAVALAPASTASQERVVVPGEPACACAVQFEKVVTLDDSDGRAGLARPLVVHRTAGGEYLVEPSNRQGVILLFDEAGVFVRQVGAPGQGPREFGAVLGIESGPADSTYVMDAGNRRLAVLDPELGIARTARAPVVGGWFGVLDDGSVLVLREIPRAGGNRLGLVDSSMEPIRSFLGSPPTGPENISSLRRRIWVTPTGTVAVSHTDRYAVEIWDVSGTHLRTLVREPDWFELPRDQAGTSAGPPSPVQGRPLLETEGRLWTMIHVPDEDWQEALSTVTGLYGRTGQGVAHGDRDQYFDSIIEVIDPVAGQLLASLRVDPYLTFISSEGFAASYREDQVGLPFVDVWRLTLLQRPDD